MNPFSPTDVYETLEDAVRLGVVSMEDLVTVGVGFARLTVQGIDVKAVMLALVQAYPQHTALIYESFEKPCPKEDVIIALERRWGKLDETPIGHIILDELAAITEPSEKI